MKQRPMKHILDIVLDIFEQPVCDHCLGRQFAQLMHGFTNQERGRILRSAAAMYLDSGIDVNVDMSNFSSFVFHNSNLKTRKEKKSRKKKKKLGKKLEFLENFYGDVVDLLKKGYDEKMIVKKMDKESKFIKVFSFGNVSFANMVRSVIKSERDIE